MHQGHQQHYRHRWRHGDDHMSATIQTQPTRSNYLIEVLIINLCKKEEIKRLLEIETHKKYIKHIIKNAMIFQFNIVMFQPVQWWIEIHPTFFIYLRANEFRYVASSTIYCQIRVVTVRLLVCKSPCLDSTSSIRFFAQIELKMKKKICNKIY